VFEIKEILIKKKYEETGEDEERKKRNTEGNGYTKDEMRYKERNKRVK
jgi:hypothetical protein